MKRWLTFIAFTVSYGISISQVTVTNKGVVITNLNKNIYINGNVVNQSTGLIKNGGSVYISGDITNNSSTALSDSSIGQIILNGNDQVISGTHPTNFHKLILNTGDTLVLNQSIKITDSLVFSNGFIHLNGNNIDLDSTGYLANERNNGRIYGSLGTVKFKTYLNNPSLASNPGGLGLKLKSTNNHGKVLIERSHTQQPAADSGIYRVFKVSAQNIKSIDSVLIEYYADEQFKSELEYKIFSKKVSGSNGWINRDGTVSVANKNVATALNITLDTLYFTIANETCTNPPDIHVTGTTTVIPLMTIDTITCSNDTVNVNAYSLNPNALFSWKDMSDSIYPNPLQTTIPGFYFIEVSDGVNGCANNVLVNILQNKTPPLLDPLPDSLFTNCSQSTVVLNGNSLTPQTTLVWSGPSFSSPNPATASAGGKYYLAATHSDNGCTSTDSLIVDYKPEIIISTCNDTTICKSSSAILSAAAVGSITGVQYLWSNGSSSPTLSVHPTVTTSYIITATSTGCSGKDTVVVTVPPDLLDSVATYKPCNGTKFGTILVYAQGGIPPYQFSINNGSTFSSTGTFANVPFGSYNVVIKDSLGCTKNTTTTLNGFSGLPIPQFIASTQNSKGDTVVLVDISTPQPDSVKWTLPTQATVIGGDKFNPVVYMADTGAFSVTMTAYWADCVLDTTKIIHFHPVDTSFASEYNNNGIKSVTLYPNPTNGAFTVGVEFYKKQNSSIQVWGASSTKYYQKNYSDTDKIILPLTLSQLTNGTYILKVIGEYNSKYLSFVISQ